MSEEDRWAEIRKVLKAPPGKFRVVEVDTFAPPGEGHTVVGDYDTLEEARSRLKEGTEDTPRYVYDDQGQELSESEEVVPPDDSDRLIRKVRERARREGGDESVQSDAVIALLDKRIKAKDRKKKKSPKGRPKKKVSSGS